MLALQSPERLVEKRQRKPDRTMVQIAVWAAKIEKNENLKYHKIVKKSATAPPIAPLEAYFYSLSSGEIGGAISLKLNF